jgi:hypothetical protein
MTAAMLEEIDLDVLDIELPRGYGQEGGCRITMTRYGVTGYGTCSAATAGDACHDEHVELGIPDGPSPVSTFSRLVSKARHREWPSIVSGSGMRPN